MTCILLAQRVPADGVLAAGASPTLHEGSVQDAPVGPFDGATWLLALHIVAQ